MADLRGIIDAVEGGNGLNNAAAELVCLGNSSLHRNFCSCKYLTDVDTIKARQWKSRIIFLQMEKIYHTEKRSQKHASDYELGLLLIRLEEGSGETQGQIEVEHVKGRPGDEPKEALLKNALFMRAGNV
ncbi:unnamed protein product [Urochloa humidicola]